MPDPGQSFKAYCKRNRMRYTPERDVIMREVFLTHGHFDADRLYSSIRKRYPFLKIAKGSVYRTIPHLIGAGLIRESLPDENRKYYEPVLGNKHHDHMKCLGCGRIFEFYDKKIDDAQDKLLKKMKFKMTGHIHVISGYCEKCTEKVHSS